MDIFHNRCRWWHIICIACTYPLSCMAMGPYSGLHYTPTSLLLPKQSIPMGKKDSRQAANFLLTEQQKKRYRSFRDTINEMVTGNVQKVTTRRLQHALYWITAADSIASVILNEYTSFFFPGSSIIISNEKQGVVREVYSKLFYFARMRPRLLYSIGALVRALSLCTPLKHLLDPTVGVGAGINFFAFLAGSRVRSLLMLRS